MNDTAFGALGCVVNMQCLAPATGTIIESTCYWYHCLALKPAVYKLLTEDGIAAHYYHLILT